MLYFTFGLVMYMVSLFVPSVSDNYFAFMPIVAIDTGLFQDTWIFLKQVQHKSRLSSESVKTAT